MSGNEKQIEYWNEVAGPKWIRLGQAMEARLEAVNRLLIERAAPLPGEAVLDVGCGTGSTTLPVAALVGPAGHATGIDVSAPMLEMARKRIVERDNIDLVQEDVAAARLPRRFDLIVSRFGVMFFADPVAAFSNLRRMLKPEGRLCFACWAPLADNPHWRIPLEIAERRLGPAKPKPPRAPGPLAFSDADYVREILSAAGFAGIGVAAEAVPVLDGSLDDAADIACFMGPAGALLDEKAADAQSREAIRREIREAFTKYDTSVPLRLPATVLIVTARG
ncbi:MAG TPA: methyltransferase domain-containing protein [Acetobacteraceae bacterium]|nr:methyltransferase domain-containing protein [Acetobacteraceae bacterium]